MPDYGKFYPIFVRTEDDLRDDWDVRANAGMTPADPEWVDTRPGSMYHLATQAMIIEFASAYDRMNEAIAASILSTSWGDKLDLHAESYGEQRILATFATGVVAFVGDAGTVIGTGVRVNGAQTDPEVEPPIFETITSGIISGAVNTTGTLNLTVQAIEAGEAGNVPANTIVIMQSSAEGIDTVSNVAAFGGGADDETDDDLKKRLLLAFTGKGSGTMSDYIREGLRWPSVGRVKVVPHWNGPGTVKLIILDDNGDPMLGTVVTDLQTHMDPVPTIGAGWAPINHEVTVATPAAVAVNVAAQIVFAAGFNLDGASGGVALREAITEAVREYLDALQAGDDVVINHVRAQFFLVEGVYNVNNLTIGTANPPVGTTDIVITDSQVAQSNLVQLT